MASGKIELQVSEDDHDVGYVSLSTHPGPRPGVVCKSIELRELLKDYEGPELVFDFDAAGILIGIEILG